MTENDKNSKVPRLRFKDENGENYPEWEMRTLGDVIDTGKAGGTPKTTDASNYNGAIPFLSISDITSAGKYVSKTEKTLTDKGLKESAAWLVPANSLLYAMYASVGKMCFNKVPLATSQAIFAMTMKDSADQGYIYYALDNFNSNHLFAMLQTGTQSNISAALLRSILIPVPSLPEQERIAGFLSALDENIEANEELLELLKVEKTGYLQKIFNRELRFMDDNGENYPEWEIKTLGEVCNFEKGQQINRDQLSEIKTDDFPYPLYNGGIIQSGYFNKSNNNGYHVTISEGGNAGYVRYVKGKFWSGGHNYIAKNISSSQNFIFQLLKYLEKTLQNNARGTTIKNLQKKEINQISTYIPSSLPEQEKIAGFLSAIDDRIDAQTELIKTLKEEKKAYLQRIFG